MNAFQEVILDRLLGANATDFQDNHGPVGLALRALVDARLMEPSDPAEALGYPLMLHKALHAGCAMLGTTEEKRQLALTVFGEVSPASVPVHPPPRRQIETSLWCAERVHPLVCRSACPVLSATRKLLELFFTGDPLRDLPLELSQATLATCQASNRVIFDEVNHSGITLRLISRRTLQSPLAAAQALRSGQKVEEYASVAAAYAGRLAAHFLGRNGAAEFCRALVQELRT